MSCMKLDGQLNNLLFVGFNQNYQCFACGTTTGFIIYNADPFKETFRRDFPNGGIGYVEMLFRCNILALVGGGQNPRYPPNKVMIWDDHQNRCIGELSFRSEVKAVKLRRDRVVVILEHKIYVYDFSHLKLLDHIETTSNIRGLCSLCPDPDNTVLVCPGLQKGYLRVELYDIKRMNLIQAHDSTLGCFALSLDGKLLATASERGTLIRIWDTSTGDKIQELRRGADHAEIQSICFSPKTSKYLAVSSDKGTIHIFKVKKDITGMQAAKKAKQQQQSSSQQTNDKNSNNDKSSNDKPNKNNNNEDLSGEEDNRQSSLGVFKSVLPKYFSSEWSFAQFRVPVVRAIVAFGSDENSIVVVSADGTFYKAVFDAQKGGECQKEKEADFLKVKQ
jgi:WD40 repeat protein